MVVLEKKKSVSGDEAADFDKVSDVTYDATHIETSDT